jgi:hypothetical protein
MTPIHLTASSNSCVTAYVQYSQKSVLILPSRTGLAPPVMVQLVVIARIKFTMTLDLLKTGGLVRARRTCPLCSVSDRVSSPRKEIRVSDGARSEQGHNKAPRTIT